MPDQKILDYIKAKLQAGDSREKITADLMSQGTLPSEINTAFTTLGAVSPQNQATVLPDLSPISQPKKSHVFSIIVTILVLLAVSGGAVWAYMNFVSPDPQKTVNKSIAKLADEIVKEGYSNIVGSFEMKGSGNVIPEAPSAKAEWVITGSANTKSDAVSGKGASTFSFNVDIKTSGINIKIDGRDFLDIFGSKSDDALYLRLNNIPSGLELFAAAVQPQIDIINKKMVGKWIRIDQKELDELAKYGYSPESLDAFSLSESNLDATTTETVSLLVRNASIFDVSETLPSETLNGKSVLHYRLNVNKENLLTLLSEIIKVSLDEQSKKDFNEQEMRKSINESFSYIEKSGVKIQTDLWVDRFSKLPVKVSVGVDVSSLPELKQMGLQTTISFNTVFDFPNKLDITEPASAVGLSDMFATLGVLNP